MNLSTSRLEKILFIILFIRPSLDLFTHITLFGSSLRINPASLLSLFIIMLGLNCFWHCANDERKSLLKNPLIVGSCVWILPLFLWAVIPVITIGTERLSGIREWVRLFSFIPLTMMVLYITKSTKRLTLIYAVMASFVIPAMVGIYQWVFQESDLIKNVPRLSSTFVHPNSFAFYLALIACLFYWMLHSSRHKAISGIGLILSLALLLATYSFTGAITLMTAAFILLLGANHHLRTASILAVILFCAVFAVSPTGYQRMKDELHIENLDLIEQTGKQTSSLTWRFVNWRFLYRQWRLSPIVGHGLESIPIINPMLNRDKVGSDAHNDYILYLTETGMIGLLLYLCMLVYVGKALWQAYRRAENDEAKNLALTALALYGAWLVSSLADNLISITAYQYALWTIMACAVSHLYINLQDRVSCKIQKLKIFRMDRQ